MAKFITGKELTNEVEEIIHSAKKQLLILSPYVKLDDYFKNLFSKHKRNADLHIIIAFGKNKKNPERSLKLEDLKFFMDFPNVSIVFIQNLHAKYYANEKKGVVTSINLYDYSFKNNVEFGVLSESKFFGGSGIDKDAWDTSMKVLKDGYSIFIKRPHYKKKFYLINDYQGSGILLDLTEQLLNNQKLEKRNVFEFIDRTFIDTPLEKKRLSRDDFEKIKESKIPDQTSSKSKPKLVSATNLGKIKNKTFDQVITIMLERGYISDKSTITVLGNSAGLRYKENAKGHKWIVYPESFIEFL